MVESIVATADRQVLFRAKWKYNCVSQGPVTAGRLNRTPYMKTASSTNCLTLLGNSRRIFIVVVCRWWNVCVRLGMHEHPQRYYIPYVLSLLRHYPPARGWHLRLSNSHQYLYKDSLLIWITPGQNIISQGPDTTFPFFHSGTRPLWR